MPNSWAGENDAAVDTTDELLNQGLFVRLHLIQGTGVFRCPSDRATAQQRPRTRSYSLDASFAGHTNVVRTLFSQVQEVRNPSQAFVFVDESAETIDDGHFLVWPDPDTRWVNLPTDRHALGAAFSFVDGHAERWRWKWRKRFKPDNGSYWMESTAKDRTDLRRLQAALPVR